MCNTFFKSCIDCRKMFPTRFLITVLYGHFNRQKYFFQWFLVFFLSVSTVKINTTQLLYLVLFTLLNLHCSDRYTRINYNLYDLTNIFEYFIIYEVINARSGQVFKVTKHFETSTKRIVETRA